VFGKGGAVLFCGIYSVVIDVAWPSDATLASFLSPILVQSSDLVSLFTCIRTS